MNEFPEHLARLALFRKFLAHVEVAWPDFLVRRRERLVQAQRLGGAAEKVAENILDDFFTVALDWKIENLNNQVQYADMVLTLNGMKKLIIEVKRPGSLAWDRSSLERALEQAWQYADDQKVKTIAVSDGTLFYAADIINGGLQPRARLTLDRPEFSANSWWVSVDGIYRPPESLPELQPIIDKATMAAASDDPCTAAEARASSLLHHKYKVPARCFAYVGDGSDTKTWKLPCWLITGEVDIGRLPGAIRAVLMTYRGARVTIPEAAVPDVLVRLGKAAAAASKLPGQTPNPQLSYQQLYDALHQLGRLGEVLPEGLPV